jgi:hypothetical protein
MKRETFLKAMLCFPLISKALAIETDTRGREDIFAYGAKGNGKSDDTEAFRKYLKSHDSIRLPSGHTFVLGGLELDGKSISGPGSISIRSGSLNALVLKGQGSRVSEITFVGAGTGKRPETHILLEEKTEYALISGCSFEGKLFNAIGCGVNSEIDAPIKDKALRKKIIVSHCRFKGQYSHHLYLHLIENLIVQGNFFEDSGHDSIRLRQLVKTINITDNHFKNIGLAKDMDSRDAIDCFWSGYQLIVSNNHFEDITVHGIDLKGHSPDLDYGTSKVNVIGNQFRNIGFNGMLISSGAKTLSGWKAIKNITIAQNHFEGCGHASTNPNDAAIFMRHNQEMIIIEGNQFYRNFNKALLVGNFEVGAPISRDIIISNNLISNNGRSMVKESYGIHILGGKNIIISSNILSNDVTAKNPYQTKGIVVEKYKQYGADEILNAGNIEKNLN